MWVMQGRFEGCATPQDPQRLKAFLDEAAAQTNDFYKQSLIEELRSKLAASK
jgi:hypothetical protein